MDLIKANYLIKSKNFEANQFLKRQFVFLASKGQIWQPRTGICPSSRQKKDPAKKKIPFPPN